MADKKISELTSGGSVQSGDAFVISRSGANYRVASDDVLSSNSWPLEQYVQVVVTEAQLRTLFSVPTTIVAAAAGVAHFVSKWMFTRAAGSAYTLNSSTLFALGINGTGYGQATTDSMFGGAGPYKMVGISPAYLTYNLKVNGFDNTNQRIYLYANVADMTGGTGTLTVDLWYWSWTP